MNSLSSSMNSLEWRRSKVLDGRQFIHKILGLLWNSVFNHLVPIGLRWRKTCTKCKTKTNILLLLLSLSMTYLGLASEDYNDDERVMLFIFSPLLYDTF